MNKQWVKSLFDELHDNLIYAILRFYLVWIKLKFLIIKAWILIWVV